MTETKIGGGNEAAAPVVANGGHQVANHQEMNATPSLASASADAALDAVVMSGSAAVSVTPPPAPQAGSGPGGAKATRPPCAFFLTNSCRHGDQCRFSHDPAHLTNPPPASQRPSPPGAGGSPYAPDGSGKPPPILMIQTPPGHPIFSIDVECVATGVQHNARSIAQVALGASPLLIRQLPSHRLFGEHRTFHLTFSSPSRTRFHPP